MSYARRGGCMDWLIYGHADWEYIGGKLREWGPALAGALFGAGWWAWADAIVYTQAVTHEHFPATYYLPGLVATLALVLMNCISRDDIAAMQDSYGDESVESRARIWLLFSYLVAFGSVAGSVTVLIVCVQNHQAIWVGVAGLMQCGLILFAALLFWAFRTQDDSGYVGY